MKGKSELTALINESIEMLSLCDYHEQAERFKESLDVLQNNPIPSEEFQKVLNEITRILAGMYSFSELSLIPKGETHLTAEDLRLRQWNLVAEINRAIKQLKTDDIS